MGKDGDGCWCRHCGGFFLLCWSFLESQHSLLTLSYAPILASISHPFFLYFCLSHTKSKRKPCLISVALGSLLFALDISIIFLRAAFLFFFVLIKSVCVCVCVCVRWHVPCGHKHGEMDRVDDRSDCVEEK